MSAGHYAGSDQFLTYQSGEMASAAAVGILTGGNGFNVESKSRNRKGINLEEINRAGLLDYTGSANVVLTPDGAGLLVSILVPTTGVYDELVLGGNMGDGVVEHDPAYCTKLVLKVANGDSLTADLSWLGLPGSGTPTAVDITDDWNWEEYDQTTTITGVTANVESAQYEFDFAVRYKDGIGAKTAAVKRQHVALIHKGLSGEKATVELSAPPGENLTLDYPAANITVQSVFVSNSTEPVTLTVGIANLMWDGPPQASGFVDENGDVKWSGTLVPRNKKLSPPICTVDIDEGS